MYTSPRTLLCVAILATLLVESAAQAVIWTEKFDSSATNAAGRPRLSADLTPGYSLQDWPGPGPRPWSVLLLDGATNCDVPLGFLESTSYRFNNALSVFKIVDSGSVVWAGPVIATSAFSNLNLIWQMATNISGELCQLNGATVNVALMTSSDQITWTAASSRLVSCWTQATQTFSMSIVGSAAYAQVQITFSKLCNAPKIMIDNFQLSGTALDCKRIKQESNQLGDVHVVPTIGSQCSFSSGCVNMSIFTAFDISSEQSLTAGETTVSFWFRGYKSTKVTRSVVIFDPNILVASTMRGVLTVLGNTIPNINTTSWDGDGWHAVSMALSWVCDNKKMCVAKASLAIDGKVFAPVKSKPLFGVRRIRSLLTGNVENTQLQLARVTVRNYALTPEQQLSAFNADVCFQQAAATSETTTTTTVTDFTKAPTQTKKKTTIPVVKSSSKDDSVSLARARKIL